MTSRSPFYDKLHFNLSNVVCLINNIYAHGSKDPFQLRIIDESCYEGYV